MNETGREKESHSIRNGLSKSICATVILAGLSLGGLVTYSCTPSKQEIEQKKKLEEEKLREEKIRNTFINKINYIRPPNNENRTYLLDDGSEVTISYSRESRFLSNPDCRLKISMKEVQFTSYSEDDRFDRLHGLFLLRNGNWEEYNWRTADIWQDRYEKIVTEIYDVRAKLENSVGSQLDEIINGE